MKIHGSYSGYGSFINSSYKSQSKYEIYFLQLELNQSINPKGVIWELKATTIKTHQQMCFKELPTQPIFLSKPLSTTELKYPMIWPWSKSSEKYGGAH